VIALAAASGAAGSLGNALENHFTGNRALPLMAGLFIALLLGPLFGVIGLYLSAGLVRWTGSWLGGVATPDEARAAVAWATVPTLWGMLLWLPILATGGRVDAVMTLVGLAQAVLGIWTFVISLKCLGEAHRFSAWKALGAEILAGLIVLVPFACLLFAILGAR
ncbi:MAG TPA: YIP1 family protein, partial [Herpetosiphonaceae bacterium]